MGQTRQRDFLTTFAEGRSGRWQFWSFYAFVAVPAAGLYGAFLIGDNRKWELALQFGAFIWALLFIVPLTAAMSRRFHDIGRSGWWALLQFAIIFTVLVGGMIYSNVARPERDFSCLRFYGFGSLFGDVTSTPQFTPPPLTPEQKEECDAADTRIRAFDDRLEALGWLSLASIVVSHIATLLPILKASQPGPNKYGPNPHEVPQ